jgi:hypothetical protein
MSQENVETLQRIFDEVNVRLDVPQELFDPAFELVLTELGDGGVFRDSTPCWKPCSPNGRRSRTSITRSKR